MNGQTRENNKVDEVVRHTSGQKSREKSLKKKQGVQWRGRPYGLKKRTKADRNQKRVKNIRLCPEPNTALNKNLAYKQGNTSATHKNGGTGGRVERGKRIRIGPVWETRRKKKTNQNKTSVDVVGGLGREPELSGTKSVKKKEPEGGSQLPKREPSGSAGASAGKKKHWVEAGRTNFQNTVEAIKQFIIENVKTGTLVVGGCMKNHIK